MHSEPSWISCSFPRSVATSRFHFWLSHIAGLPGLLAKLPLTVLCNKWPWKFDVSDLDSTSIPGLDIHGETNQSMAKSSDENKYTWETKAIRVCLKIWCPIILLLVTIFRRYSGQFEVSPMFNLRPFSSLASLQELSWSAARKIPSISNHQTNDLSSKSYILQRILSVSPLYHFNSTIMIIT